MITNISFSTLKKGHNLTGGYERKKHNDTQLYAVSIQFAKNRKRIEQQETI